MEPSCVVFSRPNGNACTNRHEIFSFFYQKLSFFFYFIFLLAYLVIKSITYLKKIYLKIALKRLEGPVSVVRL